MRGAVGTRSVCAGRHDDSTQRGGRARSASAANIPPLCAPPMTARARTTAPLHWQPQTRGGVVLPHVHCACRPPPPPSPLRGRGPATQRPHRHSHTCTAPHAPGRQKRRVRCSSAAAVWRGAGGPLPPMRIYDGGGVSGRITPHARAEAPQGRPSWAVLQEGQRRASCGPRGRGSRRKCHTGGCGDGEAALVRYTRDCRAAGTLPMRSGKVHRRCRRVCM